MPGPLQGIKVLEFTEIIAGPLGGMLLSDMGADVIKIEPPWGDPWRMWAQFMPGESRQHLALNRGKRGITLDLSKPEARDIVYKLVPDMDVAIVNYRPGVPKNLGVDYATLSALNPGLVYCENTAFGAEGPDSQRRGYDIIVQALSGFMAAEGKLLDGVPQPLMSTAVADCATALVIAWGVTAALFDRQRTGLGQKVETTLLGTALGLLTQRFLRVQSHDAPAQDQFLQEVHALRSGGAAFDDLKASHDTLLPAFQLTIYYGSYRTSDGVIVVACLSDPLRRRLLDVLELEDIRFQPDYDPDSPQTEAFNTELQLRAKDLFRQKTTADWLDLLKQKGIPAGPIKFVEELLYDPQVEANGLGVDLEHTLAGKLRMVGPLLQMDRTPLAAQRASPALGEHTNEVLSSLGYTGEQIARLRTDGVIG